MRRRPAWSWGRLPSKSRPERHYDMPSAAPVPGVVVVSGWASATRRARIPGACLSASSHRDATVDAAQTERPLPRTEALETLYRAEVEDLTSRFERRYGVKPDARAAKAIDAAARKIAKADEARIYREVEARNRAMRRRLDDESRRRGTGAARAAPPVSVSDRPMVGVAVQQGRNEARPGGDSSDPSEPEPPALARCTRPRCRGGGLWLAVPGRSSCLHCIVSLEARAAEFRRRAS